MDSLKVRGEQDRSKINMHQPHEIECWTKHLKISKQQLQKAVDRVGNSAAAVRKELAVRAGVERARSELSGGRDPRIRRDSIIER